MVHLGEDTRLEKSVVFYEKFFCCLDDRSFAQHEDLSDSFVFVFSGKSVKVFPGGGLENRQTAVHLFNSACIERGIDIRYSSNFRKNLLYFGVDSMENGRSGGWQAEFKTAVNEIRRFAAEKDKVVLVVSHFHEFSNEEMVCYPHIHCIFNFSFVQENELKYYVLKKSCKKIVK